MDLVLRQSVSMVALEGVAFHGNRLASVSLAGLHPRGRMSTLLATVSAGGNADKED
jgi:hypothetical protein